MQKFETYNLFRLFFRLYYIIITYIMTISTIFIYITPSIIIS